MKKIFRVVIIIGIFILMALICTTPVFAAPSDIANISITCTDTTISLWWSIAAGSTSTVIRYSTITYPATPAGGTAVYSGSDSSYTLSGLIAGTTYYFSAWGYDGATYSTNKITTVITTYPVALPSGGTTVVPPKVPIPTIPSNATQSANASGLSLQPITNILTYLNDTNYGGLGMPINNLWETIAIFGMVTVSGAIYIKQRNFFIAYFVLFLLTCFAVALKLVQGYLVPIEIAVGVGVWAIERFLQ